MKRLFFLFLCLFPLVAGATTVRDLYDFRLIVADQGEAERERAVRRAFADLLVRVSGDRQAPAGEAGQALLGEASRYLRQFRYSSLAMPGFPATDSQGPYTPLQQIHLVFDEEGVNRALWRQGLPVWGKNRPATLVWLAVQEGGRRWLAGSEAGEDLLAPLRQRAAWRGLPVVFPLLDLQDQIALDVNEVWGNFAESIRAASRRYRPEAILVGRLLHLPDGEWLGRWSLYFEGDEVLNWEQRGDQAAPIVVAGIDQVADELASRYAQVAGEHDAGEFLLRVAGVRALADFVRAERYLRSLAPVEQVQVAVVEPGQVTFRLRLRGSRGGLEKAIALSPVLEPLPDNAFAEHRLSYRLQP